MHETMDKEFEEDKAKQPEAVVSMDAYLLIDQELKELKETS